MKLIAIFPRPRKLVGERQGESVFKAITYLGFDASGMQWAFVETVEAVATMEPVRKLVRREARWRPVLAVYLPEQPTNAADFVDLNHYA